MSRAELRRAEREKNKKTATYNLTYEQIKGIKNQAIDEASETAFILLLGLPIMVLHDKWDKLLDPETRLEVMEDELLNLYDSFDKGYLTLEDVKNTIHEETGVKIREKRK